MLGALCSCSLGSETALHNARRSQLLCTIMMYRMNFCVRAVSTAPASPPYHAHLSVKVREAAAAGSALLLLVNAALLLLLAAAAADGTAAACFKLPGVRVLVGQQTRGGEDGCKRRNRGCVRALHSLADRAPTTHSCDV